jgi:serine/threonine-protein kinase
MTSVHAGLAAGLAALGVLAWLARSAGKKKIQAAAAARGPAPARGGLAGRRVGTHFELVRRIGAGGMGEVYEAVDLRLKRKVALKKLLDAHKDSAACRQRLLNEALILGAISHPSIITVHEVIEDAGDIYLVCELIEGRTLDQEMGRKGRYTPQEAAAIARPVGEALDCAHCQGVIHRDLKPGNIMLVDGRPKVMDFGLAHKTKSADHTLTGNFAGTMAYMAPEQFLGVLCKQTDLYALAVCLFQMLTGELPFRGEGQLDAKMAARFTPASALVSRLPPPLDAFFAKALAADYHARFDSGAAMMLAFEEACR